MKHRGSSQHVRGATTRADHPPQYDSNPSHWLKQMFYGGFKTFVVLQQERCWVDGSSAQRADIRRFEHRLRRTVPRDR
ncbi:hypothetical protein GCM10008098_09270 [Rhodanobacter panaciterrae]|uniref:Transposase n=1 Tax=Rhodanobacter panaciterrae TaxID=490572 RepID=A0ABQ2ZLF4_9GAMM|nr:hypothetical protein GCM10008098_09270 [Rhodanobacter panaciterrae]